MCITTGKRENISLSNLMVQVSLLFYYRVRQPLPSKYYLGLILPMVWDIPSGLLGVLPIASYSYSVV